MNTLELIKKIAENAGKNPMFLQKMEWDELGALVERELEYRAGVYSEQQYEMLERRVEELIGDLKRGLIVNSAVLLAELEGIVRGMPDFDSFYDKSCLAAFEHEVLRHYREKTVIVLGDSHVSFFSGNEHLDLTPVGDDINVCKSVNGLPFTVLHCGPCLAYNCNKPNSTYAFREKVQRLKHDLISPGAKVLVSLGEIDIRAHVFKESMKREVSAERIVDSILDNYMVFLTGLCAEGYRVYCWGPIATQRDGNPNVDQYPHFGTEIERNRITEYFNKQLQERCEGAKIGFLTIFPEMITEGFETKEEYLSDDHFHLGQAAMTLAMPKLHHAGLI